MTDFSFDDFLERESDKRKFPWRDTSQWTPEKIKPLWIKAGASITNPQKKKDFEYQGLDPKLTDNLQKYLLRDDSFKGDLDKGILIIGNNGTGKTAYMKTFLLLLHYLHLKKTPTYTGKQIETCMRLEETEQKRIDLYNHLLSPTFFFDDIGEELDRVIVYGTTVELGKDVLNDRHQEMTSNGNLTFGTSNLNMKQLGDKYGPRVHSRLFEMFNVFILEGEDLRRTLNK